MPSKGAPVPAPLSIVPMKYDRLGLGGKDLPSRSAGSRPSPGRQAPPAVVSSTFSALAGAPISIMDRSSAYVPTPANAAPLNSLVDAVYAPVHTPNFG